MASIGTIRNRVLENALSHIDLSSFRPCDFTDFGYDSFYFLTLEIIF